MKLTQDFIDKLTHLSKINSRVLLKEGNIQSIKNGDQCLATVQLEDNIPQDAAILEIVYFINTLSLFPIDKTNLEFHEDHILISSDNQSARYNTTRPDFIKNVIPTANVMGVATSGNLGDELFTIDLSVETFEKIGKNAKTMDLQHIVFNVNKGLLEIDICDKENSGKNSIKTVIGEVDSPEISYVFNTADFMTIPKNNYKLSLYKTVGCFILTSDSFNMFLGANQKGTVKAK